MSIIVELKGDVDRLPHKDLGEHIVRLIEAAVKDVCDKAGIQYTKDIPQATNTRAREFLGGKPYTDTNYTEARAYWYVNLPDKGR